jgi:hypothetical protein
MRFRLLIFCSPETEAAQRATEQENSAVPRFLWDWLLSST